MSESSAKELGTIPTHTIPSVTATEIGTSSHPCRTWQAAVSMIRVQADTRFFMSSVPFVSVQCIQGHRGDRHGREDCRGGHDADRYDGC